MIGRDFFHVGEVKASKRHSVYCIMAVARNADPPIFVLGLAQIWKAYDKIGVHASLRTAKMIVDTKKIAV